MRQYTEGRIHFLAEYSVKLPIRQYTRSRTHTDCLASVKLPIRQYTIVEQIDAHKKQQVRLNYGLSTQKIPTFVSACFN